MPTFDRFRRSDRQLTRRVASWDSARLRQTLSAAESAAAHTTLWWASAALMAAAGGRSGRKAATKGLVSMLAAQLLANGACKRLYERSRPPQELIAYSDVEDRPDSSSFPSGHTAAAVGFTAGVVVTSPSWGTAAAVPAALVGLQRVHSGAHYPSDVAAGAVIGLLSASLVHYGPRLLPRKAL
jgi:undecaprenyl-diphosphatase